MLIVNQQIQLYNMSHPIKSIDAYACMGQKEIRGRSFSHGKWVTMFVMNQETQLYYMRVTQSRDMIIDVRVGQEVIR